MKLKITLALILIANFLFCQEKEFEGIIDYKLVVKNPMPELMSDSLWIARVGKTISNHKYYYKGSNYKNVIDKKQLQIYKPKSNQIYNYTIEKDTVFTNILNANKSIDSLRSIEKSDKTELILGYECQELIIKTKLTETTYYYSRELNIPSVNYINHHYGNWYEYLKETNSLPLKIIVKNKFLFMEMTAINLESKELNIDEFKLPKTKKD
jgi:hypothetical protein